MSSSEKMVQFAPRYWKWYGEVKKYGSPYQCYISCHEYHEHWSFYLTWACDPEASIQAWEYDKPRYATQDEALKAFIKEVEDFYDL